MQDRPLSPPANLPEDPPSPSLAVLSAAERDAIVRGFNETQRDYPGPVSVARLFESISCVRPDQIAVADGIRHLSYRELNSRSNQLARHLVALGVRSETLVGVCLRRSVDLAVAILGVLKAEGAWLPLDPAHPADRLETFLDQTRPSVVLTDASSPADLLQMARVRVVRIGLDWPEISRNSPLDLETSAGPRDAAYVIHTSGSTGKPKAVLLTQGGLWTYLRAIGEALAIVPSDIYLHTASIGFSSSVRQLLLPLTRGATCWIASQEQLKDPAVLFETIKRQSVTVIDIVPSYWRAAMDALDDLDRDSRATLLTNSLRLVLSASEPLAFELVRRWRAQIGRPVRVVNMFGQTETTGIVTVYPIPENMQDRVGVVPLGRPLANRRVYVLDPNRMPLPIGAVGEICVGGAGLAREYLGNDSETRRSFHGDPFGGEPDARLYRTGDLGSLQADGTLEYRGRRDDQVKIRGFRIELHEVAHALELHPEVRECAVIVREDVSGNKQLLAYVALHHGSKMETAQLRAHVASKLPEPMVPAHIVRLESLPRTPSGKIDRLALPSSERVRPGPESALPPRTAAEKTLVEIWTDVLGVERVGIHEDFFELGGDSIASFRMIARASRKGISVTVGQLTAHPTIAGLASVAATEAAAGAEQEPGGGIVSPTPIARRFWEWRGGSPNHYNQAVFLETRPGADPRLLRRAIEALINRHDALRLRTVASADGPRQFIPSAGEEPAFERFDFTGLPGDARRVREAASLFQCLDQSAAAYEDPVEAAAARLQTSLDVARGPITRAAFFELGAGSGRLLLCIHHLAVDGVSWRILLEDLNTAYEQLARGEEVELPPRTTSFQLWSKRLAAHAESPEVLKDAPFWTRLAGQNLVGLPRDGPSPESNTVTSTRVISLSLDGDETETLLRESAKTYRAGVTELLLAALARAFEPWTGSRSLLVEVEGHGREDIGVEVDLSRSVGWFTSSFPILLDTSAARGAEEQVRRIKEQYREAHRRQLSYGLLRYVGDAQIRRTLERLPQPEVRLNYLGQFDRVLPANSIFRLTRESPGPSAGCEGLRLYALDVFGNVLERRLTVDWAYSENVHRRDTVEALAERFLRELRILIELSRHGDVAAPVASDFPLARLDQRKLDRLMERVKHRKGSSR